MGGKLLPILQQVQNKSGAIPISPSALIQLKQGIKSVPFGIQVPSMSGVVTTANMLGGLTSLLSIFQSFLNMGNLQSILKNLLNGTASISQLTNALGGAGSLGAGLLSYSGPPANAPDAIVSSATGGTPIQEAGSVDDSSIA